MKGKRLSSFSKKSLIILYIANYLAMVAAFVYAFINWSNIINIWVIVTIIYGLIFAKFIRYEIEEKGEKKD